MFSSLVLALLSTMPATADVSANDARLNDVCFVDAQHGWAAGDRGVIWHTDDGGNRWQTQESSVTCPLWAVSFLSDQIGWAAGGFAQPYTHASSGVLLVTRDGGRTWTAMPKLMLPAVRRLGFFDPQHGWAITCRSALYPSGVFVTDDGGRTWRPLPGGTSSENAGGWLAADFASPRTGALAGRNASQALVVGSQIETIKNDAIRLQNPARLRFAGPTLGWLVGDGGLVQTTADLGATWQTPPAELPAPARQFDFAALAVRGPKCWIAGSPGTRVFSTLDAGRTWAAASTGSTVPLRAIAFADDRHGWAVGDLGAILATSDGGQTWRRQGNGNTRAALLGIFADADDIPLELIARLAGDEGYLAAVNVVGRRDIEVAPRDYVSLADRVDEAVVRAGGSSANTAWQFPLRQAGLRLSARQIVEAWDSVSDGHGIDELERHLVRQIQTWRPEVIVTRDGGREDDDPLASIIEKAVLQAVRQASDKTPTSDAGLEPWTVKRVFAAMPAGARGGTELVTAQFSSRLGHSLADATAESHGLLHDRFTLPPSVEVFRLLVNDGTQESAGRDFFGGIALAPGGPGRRELSHATTEDRNGLQRIARKRTHVQAILEQASRTAVTADQLLAQIDDLTRDLDEDRAAQIVYQLADQQYRAGRWMLAADLFQVMTERYPQHWLCPSALLWLVQYNAGSEAARRMKQNDGPKRFERAVTLGREIERTRPELFAEPALRFPLAAAYRNLGQARQAERLYQLQTRGGEGDAWSACAQGELGLSDPKSHSVRATLTCVKAETRPRLDGQLDDAMWQRAKPAALQSVQHDDGEWPGVVMFAYDAEFLYIGAHCRAGPGAKPPPPTGSTSARQHDADLSAHDRIEVLIDIDRNYAGYYRLAIDDRGWTNDSCWGDATWNPEWFVAAKWEGDVWTVEAAIPLAELTGQPPRPREIWAIGVQRVLPGVGFQSWSNPAAVSVLPEGFGYLLFE
jgi:photosystem II stability/assembly factor-like uncharacterized protein